MALEFPDPVPIFPLPGVVLFPRTALPLHVFEPRYQALTADALEGDRLIAMAMLKPGWEEHDQDRPDIFTVVGVGRIAQVQPLPDGKFHLLLEGIARARIEEEVPGKPYRLARLSAVPEPASSGDPGMAKMRLGLLAVYAALRQAGGKSGPVKIESDLTLGGLCDLLAAMLEADPLDKQAVLEEFDVVARAERVVDLLRRSAAAATPVRGAIQRAGQQWPPKPSQN